MRIDAEHADAYVLAIEPERRPHVERLRTLVKKAVPKATEGIAWGMIHYAFEGRPFAAIASHKRRMSLYLIDLYTQPALRKKYERAFVGLKMGKSCINFSSVDELPLDAIAAVLKEAPRVVVTTGTLAKKTPAPKKTAPKKAARRR